MHNTQLATIERLTRRIMLILAFVFLAALIVSAQSDSMVHSFWKYTQVLPEALVCKQSPCRPVVHSLAMVQVSCVIT